MLGLCMYPKSAADSRRKYVQINSKHRYPERYPPTGPRAYCIHVGIYCPNSLPLGEKNVFKCPHYNRKIMWQIPNSLSVMGLSIK